MDVNSNARSYLFLLFFTDEAQLTRGLSVFTLAATEHSDGLPT